MRANSITLRSLIVNINNKLISAWNKIQYFLHYSRSTIKIIVGVFLFIIVLAGVFILSTSFKKTAVTATNGQVAIPTPIATQVLNKEFDFPITDSTGKVVSNLKYIIESADVRQEIVVKGQTANAVAGKRFLVINLKIVNTNNLGVQINTKDYIRLSVNGNGNEWLAPDIHNDPVEVQAISTKYTRVGYAINTTDKHLVLRVGEINGQKQDVSLYIN